MAPTQTCTFFVKGGCKKGASCEYLHGGMAAADYVAAVASGRVPPMPATPPRPASSQCPAKPSPAQQNPQPNPGNRAPSASRRRPQGNNNQQVPGAASAAAKSLFGNIPPAPRGGGPAALGPVNGGILSTVQRKAQTQEFTVALGNGKSASVQVSAQQALLSTGKPPLVVHAFFLIDASGSMAGSRMEATMGHVSHMVNSVLDPEDPVTVWAFAEEEKLQQLYYKTRARSIKLEVLQEKVKTSGCTRLYDNCTHALQSIAKDKSLQDVDGNTILRNLVVFTDGEDNMSEAGGLERMADAVRAPGVPNFHFTCLAVGTEAREQGEKISGALKGCRHAKVITTDSASKDDIGRAFGRAQACLREARTELVEQLVIQCRSKGPDPALARAIQSGLANLNLGGGGGGKSLGGGSAGGNGGGNGGGGNGGRGRSRASTPSRARR